MKFGRTSAGETVAFDQAGGMYDVSDLFRSGWESGAIIASIAANEDDLKSRVAKAIASRKPLSGVVLDAPIPDRATVMCMAGNYWDRPELRDKEYEPDGFLKARSSLIGHNGTVVLPSVGAREFQHEAELGVVIGRETPVEVSVQDALGYVAGYVNFNDISARGLNPRGRQSFWWMKSWRTFGPVGPYLLTADEMPDPQKLSVRLWVNDKIRQDFSTSDMVQSVAETVSLVSKMITLQPGDVIATGTHHHGLGPLQDGDTVEMEIEHLGRLSAHIKDPSGRSWKTSD